MNSPVIAKTKPELVTLSAGRTYFWCSCGLSKRQPFCDGSHREGSFEPLKFTCEKDGDYLLCACKQTRKGPWCDGSHNNLSDSYEEASEEEIQASAHLPVTPRSEGETGRASLDGGCFVHTVDYRQMQQHGNLGWQSIIHPQDGARCLALYSIEARPAGEDGSEPSVMAFPGSHVALFVLSGQGQICISGRTFAVRPEQGLLIGPAEAFSIVPDAGCPNLRITATICPTRDEPAWLQDMPTDFDERLPERVFAVDESKREVMADRFYQVLIDDRSGGADLTQFLGEVPRSRAASHRHLYEETITILSGHGYMWTEGARAEVQPGDVIFLPRRQAHSLECTDEAGMRLVGVFFPSGSPAINY